VKRILIVDDSETIRNQLRRLLEGKGYEVFEGVDGQNGFEQLRAHKGVNLIICDVNMPNVDGLTMCGKIHLDQDYKSIPILMLTTESSAELKSRGKAAGVTAWITKPFDAERLIAVLQKLIP